MGRKAVLEQEYIRFLLRPHMINLAQVNCFRFLRKLVLVFGVFGMQNNLSAKRDTFVNRKTADGLSGEV